MRQLHPVSLQEKFVASGRYIYYRNHELAGITEAWAIHELPDGSQIVRVDRETRSDSHMMVLLVEALRSGKVEVGRFDTRLYSLRGAVKRELRTSCTFFDGQVQIIQSIDRAQSHYEEISLPESAIICPPTLVFLGPVIPYIAEKDPEISIFTLRFPDADSQLPIAEVVHHKVEVVGHGMLEIGGKSYDVAGYHCLGGGYDARSVFWVDTHSSIVQYEMKHDDYVYQARLTEYARRPDAIGS